MPSTSKSFSSPRQAIASPNQATLKPNIIIKITDQFYTYKKEIKDKPSKYVVKYLALKNGSEKLSVENLTVIDKEVDDDYEV